MTDTAAGMLACEETVLLWSFVLTSPRRTALPASCSRWHRCVAVEESRDDDPAVALERETLGGR